MPAASSDQPPLHLTQGSLRHPSLFKKTALRPPGLEPRTSRYFSIASSHSAASGSAFAAASSFRSLGACSPRSAAAQGAAAAVSNGNIPEGGG